MIVTPESIFNEWKEEIRSVSSKIEQMLVQGNAKDMNHYNHLTGQIAAYRQCLNRLEAITKKSREKGDMIQHTIM